MAFAVETKTLLRLEWHELVQMLRGHVRTPAARDRLAELQAPFAQNLEELEELRAETREAFGLLETGRDLPLGEISPLEASLDRACKGGGLSPRELRDIATACAVLGDTRRMLDTLDASAETLVRAGEDIVPLGVLDREIANAIGPDGTIRDEASETLARARADAQRLAAEGKQRMERTLRDRQLESSLADRFYTVRNDRFVLPVRADARASVPGIVHDASASGATLFVEPSEFVELNNRHKRAELDADREERRIIAELSAAVARAAPELRVGLEALAKLDLAFARAKFSRQIGGVPPEMGDRGVVELPGLRHPLLGDEAVPNDLRLGRTYCVLVISGPNAGGKTVAMKAAALAVLCAQAGLFVPAEPGARVDRFDTVLADIGDEQDIREHLSTFSAHMANVASVVDRADRRSFILLDEIGVGTDPSEGASLAQAILEALAARDARVITTTHYNLLKELAEVDERFENAAVAFDPETLQPTYVLRTGMAGASSALAVAQRMGMPEDVAQRARTLLASEDRQLDRMIAELQTSRAALETERAEAARLREESDSAREAYGRKLEQLEAKREKLFGEMREELQASFSRAHEEVAGVIRTLQRGGTAQAAARARERLIELESAAPESEARPVPAPSEAVAGPIDWTSARPGTRVLLPGGQQGILLSAPDRRGKVQVQAGSAKLTLASEQIRGVPKSEETARPRVRVPEPRDETLLPCDLRGERVLEAEERLERALENALAARAYQLTIIHGFGTGALRRAVRDYLQSSPYVERYESASASEGGEGATIAFLRAP